MKNTIWFLATLVAGIFIGLLLVKGCNNTSVPAPTIISPKVIKANADSIEAVKNKTIDSLNAVNDLYVAGNKKLSIQSENLKTKWLTERKNVIGLEKILNNLPFDSTERSAVTDYVDNSNLRDSICDSLVKSYCEQLVFKDSIISVKGEIIYAQDTAFKALKIQLDTCIAQEVKLIDYSKDLNKQVRKQKAGKFFWKVIAIIEPIAAILIKTLIK